MNVFTVLTFVFSVIATISGYFAVYYLGVSDGINRTSEIVDKAIRNNSYGKSDSNIEEATD